MAKCVGSVNQWQAKLKEPARDSNEYEVDNVRQGEAKIKIEVQEVFDNLLLDIATDYVRIKQAALNEDDFCLDARTIQDKVVAKLQDFIDRTCSAGAQISSATIKETSTKHAYFIQYTYGLVEKLQQISQTFGRLSEIDQKLYMEEQQKLLVSDQSIAIHVLASIWTAMLEVLETFCRQAELVFNGSADNTDTDDALSYDYLGELEFSTARDTTARIVLLDLVISSWIKFNRLLDGVSESPSAQSKGATNDGELNNLLQLILDPEHKISLMTSSARRSNVVPVDPCYANASKSDLAYFLIWHLHALCPRTKSEANKRALATCANLMEKSFKLVKESFIGDKTTITRLSPHQEERYKLLFHMLSVWCEHQPKSDHNAILLNDLFEFALSVETLPKLETKYLNNSDLSVGELTLFQLCAKLMCDTVPMSASAGRLTQSMGDADLTSEQRQLVVTWNRLLDLHDETSKSLQK